MRLGDLDKLRKEIHLEYSDDLGMLDIIDRQPTVNEWIPCSERFPSREEFLKDNGRFIVTDGNRVYQSLYDVYDDEKFVDVKYLGNANFKSDVDNRVTAWQPLPQPYKGE